MSRGAGIASSRLSRSAVLGAMWTVASSVGGRSIGLVGNLVLAALLAPADFGAASVAVIVVHTVSTFTALGFGQYILATRDAGDDVAFHATFYGVVLGWTALAAACALGDRIGPLFDAPGIAALLPGIALAAALDRLALVPTRILARDMRFRVLGLRQLAGEVAYAGVAVALAAAFGWGAGAIVAANVARAALGLGIVAATVRASRWLAPHPLRWATTRTLLGYGLPVAAGNVLYVASAKWDNLVMASLFGPAVVGQYNFAYNLADVPAAHVGTQIGDVLTPSFARVEGEARTKALARANALLALVVFPMAVGLGVVAWTLRETFLDERWAMVGGMLAILSILSVVRPIGWLVGAYLYARKLPGTVTLLEALKAAAILGCVPLFGQAGPLWACAGVGVAFALYGFASVWAVRWHDGLPASALLAPLVRPLAACAPLVVAVLAVRVALAGHGVAPGWRLALEIAAGAAAYVAAILAFARPLAREAIALVTGALRRAPPPAPAPSTATPPPPRASAR